jgi:UDP-N-acetylmuramate dehydrogenase
VLVSDAGFAGLVLHVALKGIQRDVEVFRIAAGEDWEHCVQRSIDDGCAGLECLAGIPGTAGGTPVQNVGAYGQEVASAIERVRAFDVTESRFVEFTNAECGFAYRRSRFNSTDRGRYIVTRVDYRLRENGSPSIAYQDLKVHFESWTKAPTLAEVASAVRSIRLSKGMLLVEGDPDCCSAGSFFKNPTVSQEVAERVRQVAVSTGIPVRLFPTGGGLVKIPAAWLIEQAGFTKGFRMGAAGISSRHTLALVNFGSTRGGARAEEILALAEKIRAAVEARFGIRLEMEPEMVGFESESPRVG